MRADDPRQIVVRRELEAAVTSAQMANGQRALEGKSPLAIAVCLGEGRCMMPPGIREQAACAFCAHVQVGPGTHREVETLARRIIGGH